MNKNSYTVINYIFAGIIILILGYSLVFSSLNIEYPIHCFHEQLLGAKCPSCGLTRGFAAILHGNLSQAKHIQPNSIAVFLFFIIQLVLRIGITILLRKQAYTLKAIVNFDIIVSTILFFYFFRHLVIQTLYIFYKMLLTGITS